MGREDLNYRRGRGGRPWARYKKHVYATETHCAKCGEPVDMDLPYRDPYTGRVNRWSKSVGHTVELDRGSNPYDGHLEHLTCNSTDGARYGNAKRRALDVEGDELTYSPDWED